jgi:hypothetical protein
LKTRLLSSVRQIDRATVPILAFRFPADNATVARSAKPVNEGMLARNRDPRNIPAGSLLSSLRTSPFWLHGDDLDHLPGMPSPR